MKKRYLIPLLVFIVLFGGVLTAFANSLIIEHWPTSGLSGVDYGVGAGSNWRSQSFLNNSEFNLSKITLKFGRNAVSPGSKMWLGLYKGTIFITTSTNSFFYDDISAEYWITDFDFLFNSETILADTTYWFRLILNPNLENTGTRVYMRSTDSDTYADGCMAGATGSQWPACATGINAKDILFRIYETVSPHVDFVFPVNSTSTPDFSHFHLEWDAIETLTDRGIIIVHYSTSESKAKADTPEETTDCFYNRNGCYSDVLVLENDMTFSDDETLFKHLNLSPTLWYSHAELYRDYDLEDWIFLASSTISFTITQQIPIDTFWDYPTSTITTSTVAQITCDPDDPFFQYSFCKLALYLFVPSPDAFDKFSTLSQEIEKKPPIGYFTEIKNVLSGVNASGTPVFDIGNYEPFKDSIFTPLRTGLSWLLWLFFAVVIFNRLRHLEL